MSLSVLLAMCPSCAPALEARALVFSESFWTHATYAMLPFAIVGFVVHGFVKRLGRGGHDDERDA